MRSVQTTLTRIFIELESVSDEISRKARKFKGFFRRKSGVLQKKKKKKKVFTKIEADFSFNFANSDVWWGLFSYGGAISQKIGLKSTKNMRYCILHKPMGGLKPPAPPPGYATGSMPQYVLRCCNMSHIATICDILQ